MEGVIQAFWGKHIFHATSKNVKLILEGLNFTAALDVGQLGSVEAQNPLNVKRSNKPRGFQVRSKSVLHAGGLDPLLEYNMLMMDCGKSMPFILKYLPYGAVRVILKQVELDKVIFGPKGNIISADHVCSFVEDMPATARVNDLKTKQSTQGASAAEKQAKKSEIPALNMTSGDIKKAEGKS